MNPNLKGTYKTSVAEPPLFWAAPAPALGGQGPGADSGSHLLGSAPAPEMVLEEISYF